MTSHSAREHSQYDQGITHRHYQLDQVRLHCAEMGPRDGAPVILLHGFPSFWYGWCHQLPALAEAGFRVIAPDMRGYGSSDKPGGVANYRVEVLAADIAQLIGALGHERARVVGHDWGGLVAWWLAMLHPEQLTKLSVMNCPHPSHGIAMLTSLRQLRKSWYMLYFQLPGLPEQTLAANDFAGIRRVLRRDPARADAFTDEDIDRHVEACRGDGPTTMINYYRALFRRSPWKVQRKLRPIDVETQVIWGAQDRYLGVEFAEPPAGWVRGLRFDVLDDASHWVQADRPERVNELLLDFLGAPAR